MTPADTLVDPSASVETPDGEEPVPLSRALGGAASAAPTPLVLDTSPHPIEDFVRVPGLLRRWKIQQVVQADAEFRVVEAGETIDRTPLFAVYRRDPSPIGDVNLGLAVELSFDDGQSTVRARLLPIDSDPLVGVVVFEDVPDDAGALARVRDCIARSAPPGDMARGRDREPQRQERVP